MIPPVTQADLAHPASRPARFELRFEALLPPGRALAFPCDAAGSVDIDSLSERARCNYFFARAVVGRTFARPAVVGLPAVPTALH